MAQQTHISKMETTQTAVEWLWNEIDNLIPYQDINKAQQFNGLLEQAKAMEKEHIMKAFSDGQETPISHPNLPHYSKEEYYEEKYNNGK
jgi:hypothetical protein